MRGSRARRIDRANLFLPIPTARNASSAIFLAFNPRIMPVQGGGRGGEGSVRGSRWTDSRDFSFQGKPFSLWLVKRNVTADSNRVKGFIDRWLKTYPRLVSVIATNGHACKAFQTPTFLPPPSLSMADTRVNVTPPM